MKLEYKILWIEDTPKSIRRDKRQIISYIENLGFECHVEDITNFANFEQNIGYENTLDYDLLLVDLDLGNQETKDEGNLIIKNIRDEKVYTEIIFYSSQYEELKRKLNNHFIEGIFTSSREELKDKVEQIIDVTLHKVQDVNNLRGLIMAEVAELDRIKKRIIKKFTSQVDDSFKKYIKDDVFAQLKGFFDEFDWVKKEDDSYKVINLDNLAEHFIFDSAKKARTVYKIKRRIPACSSNEYIFKEYKEYIIDKRNVLAHQEEETRDDGTKILKYQDGTDLEFTPEHCIQIRKDIRKYKKLLEEIDSKVQEV